MNENRDRRNGTMNSGGKILIVDDQAYNIKILLTILKTDYATAVAGNGKDALKTAAVWFPDLILMDVMMPEMDGYEACRKIKNNEAIRKIPIIFITSRSDIEDEAKGFELGAVDYITKPFSEPVVRARVKTHLALKFANEELENQNLILERKVRERTQELVKTQDVMIRSLAALVEARDSETGGHIKRTQNYVKVLAENLKKHPKFKPLLSDRYVELLYKSAPLHDIGKVGVPDKILLKPGKLTADEFELMKLHTVYGHDAILKAEKDLCRDSFLRIAREIAYTHQEKWDGAGYPRQLKGDEIPLSGRIMAVADVYDALISKRIYKPPLSHQTAVEIIREGKGKHFDPDIVDVFLEISDRFREIAHEFADYDEERERLESDEQ